jgi:hypothetical protein
MKAKLTLAAILSSSVIAGSLLFASVNTAQACGGMRKSAYYKQRVESTHWLRTPLAAVTILPGIAIAAALSVGNRYYKSQG